MTPHRSLFSGRWNGIPPAPTPHPNWPNSYGRWVYRHFDLIECPCDNACLCASVGCQKHYAQKSPTGINYDDIHLGLTWFGAYREGPRSPGQPKKSEIVWRNKSRLQEIFSRIGPLGFFCDTQDSSVEATRAEIFDLIGNGMVASKICSLSLVDVFLMHDTALVNSGFQRVYRNLYLPDAARDLTASQASAIHKEVRTEMTQLINQRSSVGPLDDQTTVVLDSAEKIRQICPLPTFDPDVIPGTAPRLVDLLARD